MSEETFISYSARKPVASNGRLFYFNFCFWNCLLYPYVILGGYVLIFGLLNLCFCAFFWFSDVIDEAAFMGYHTQAVRNGLKWGFMLFITSEIMLFFGFF